MREIKFRAKTLEGDLIYFDLHESQISGDSDVFYVCRQEVYCTFNTPCEVGSEQEYTGLKDKDGNEIYEGDILGGIWEGCFIKYCDKCKAFELFIPEDGCMQCSGDVIWFDVVEDGGKLEIIGNIYENPELLERK
jgi:uncharacterized phage protein (TIGR01671 family)